MALDRAPRRIIQLEKMATDDIDKLRVPSSRAETDKSKATNWHIAIDYKNEDPNAGENPEDYGTLQIPFSRVAMRDENGMIPSTMLPSYVDDIMYGKMVPDDAAHTTDPDYVSGCAVFIGVDKDEHMVGKYSTPTQPTGYLKPAENIIFFDNDTKLQYRFTNQSGTTAPLYQFAEVPGSRALNTRYGIVLESPDDQSTVYVDAKKADFFTSYAASVAVPVTSTASNIPVAVGENKSEQSDPTGATGPVPVIASNRLTKITGLIGGARYAMNLQLECTPDALSANIIDVSVTCGTVPVMKRPMDMSGPYTTSASSPNTPSVTRLDYACEFKNGDNNTELTVTISAEEAITVKTTRFTIFELL